MNFVSWQRDNLWDRFTPLAVDAIAPQLQVSASFTAFSKQLQLKASSFYG